MKDRRCRYCDVEIMYVGRLWLKKRVADVNGFCAKSPDDLHHPVSEAELKGRKGEVVYRLLGGFGVTKGETLMIAVPVLDR
jgi:hypothetical protein